MGKPLILFVKFIMPWYGFLPRLYGMLNSLVLGTLPTKNRERFMR